MAVQLNLNLCDNACIECIKQYKKKHKLSKGETFEIKCGGIPKKYIPENILSTIAQDPEILEAQLDPVKWAAKYIDWHCIDPDGSVWKRKQEDGSLKDLPPYNEERAKAGKSIFHRPYQKVMLQCRSKRKVFRIGRQNGKTEALVIAILFNIFTHTDFSVLVIAPFQSQIDLIFTRLLQLIKNSSILQGSVRRSVKAPNYTLELHNGSVVRGFTAASKSSGDAGAARGQHANMLVLDEADMLNSADLDAALAVIINDPEATVWMSSTPTGKRQGFYACCYDKMFKEFHFPSQLNPNWNDDLEKYFRSRLTTVGYVHEILADFGEQEEGVYQVKYVEAAQTDYRYETQKWISNWVYNIGVDWNDIKIGTTIRVVGWNPGDAKFYLVDKHIIQKEGWNQTAAVQAVAELNRIWKPAWIYVDHGFGHMQVEVLHKFGHDSMANPKKGPSHADSRLARIVKPYEFGGSIEVKDPFTKQLVKKPAKAFMVESSVRLFEAASLCFPKTDTNLTKALLGYKIKRLTQSGVPVYEQGDEEAGDHDLDALNLALVAFVLEESEFGRVRYSSDIAFIEGKIGETPKQKEERQLSLNLPQTGRADFSGESVGSRLPAAHTIGRMSPQRIWSWPGFNADLPPPSAPRQSRGFLRRPSPPARKKF